MNITYIVGLPGSGKSYLALKLSEENDAVIIDDPKSFSEIEKVINNGNKNIIIADCFLCEEDIRLKAIQKILSLNPEANFVWYFFENNPNKCRKNVEFRNDGRKVEGSIKRFSRSYRIPNNIKPIPIWSSVL